MSELVGLHFKPDALQNLGLPDREFYIPKEALFASVSDQGILPPELLLHGLQLKLGNNDIDPKELHSAIFALFEVLHELELENETGSEGNNWSLVYGEIDLARDEIVTIQRQDRLLAAFRQQGANLIMCGYEPLDDRALSIIKGVCMDYDGMAKEKIAENKLKYAAHRADSFGQMYSADAGASYLSYWQHGLGKSSTGEKIDTWIAQTGLKPISSIHIGTQLQVHEFFHQPEFSFNAYIKTLNNSNLTANEPSFDSGIRNKFLGCLLGGAIGDAFGAPVEFMSREQILAKCGKDGVTSLLPAYGKIGAITDDTQMTLFTAEGLLRAYVRGYHKGITSWLSCIGHAYQRWLRTQSYDSLHNLSVGSDGILWKTKELHDQRAPGNTCLKALCASSGFAEFATNNSKGCGGVMRVAPIGLFCWRMKDSFTVEECFDLASDAAHLTHGHPTGYLAAGAFAAIIYEIIDGYTLVDAAHSIIRILENKCDAQETVEAIEQALQLAKSHMTHSHAIQLMGEGWIAEEALAISLYCAIVAKDFNQLMTISVSHDGDSDSTGAIAGNLWGVIHGIGNIDESLVSQVELGELIRHISKDLFEFPKSEQFFDPTKSIMSDEIWDKYPGW